MFPTPVGDDRWIFDLLIIITYVPHELVTDVGRAILDIVGFYSCIWKLLGRYDEDSLVTPKRAGKKRQVILELDTARSAIAFLKAELLKKGKSMDIYGQEREQALAGIIGTVQDIWQL